MRQMDMVSVTAENLESTVVLTQEDAGRVELGQETGVYERGREAGFVPPSYMGPG